jgi:PAS domain S-box-containing protein
VELFSEFFDSAQFPSEQNEADFARYLHDRYAGQHIDLMLPITDSALDFTLRHRGEVLPGVPIVFLLLDPQKVKQEGLPADVTGVAAHLDFQRTVDLALQLQPQARELVVVSGASALDVSVLGEAMPVLDGYKDRLALRIVARRPLQEVIEDVRRLPKDDIVLFISMLRDGDGRAFSNPEVAQALSHASGAPIYGLTDTLVSTGVVGGALIDFPSVAQRTAVLALKTLRRARVPFGSAGTDVRDPLIVDWRALQRWHLPESLVPAEAEVMFRQPTLWEQHRRGITVLIGIMVVQAGLIAALLLSVTRLRRSEAALRESEERMNLAAEAANQGIWIRDLERKEIWASERWRNLYGFGPSERVMIDDFIERLHPEDRDPARRAMVEAIASGGSYQVEYRVMLPDGGMRWIAARGRAEFNAAGKPVRVRGVSLDITERRQAEEALRESESRFRTIANSAPVMIWISGTDKLCNFFNKGWLDFTGRTVDQELGNGWAEGVHPDDIDRCLKIYTTCFDARQEFMMQYRLRKADGEFGWVLDIGVPHFAADDTFLGYIGSAFDVTAQKQAEQEALLLRQEIAHVSRVSVMGQLAAALAHEINQPLGAILRNAEAAELFMQNASPDLEEIRAILLDIRKDDQRAGAVIDRKRSMLKRHDLETRTLDLGEVVGDVAALVQTDAVARQVNLDLDMPDRMPPVLGDRVHLQQVLLNLILNGMDAVDGASREDRRVSVSVRRNGGQTVEIAVSDTGHGIAADRLSHVFDPFFTTKPSGMGMGLPISRTIIEAHGGRLWAENDNGGGAVFRFTLPIAEEATAQ